LFLMGFSLTEEQHITVMYPTSTQGAVTLLGGFPQPASQLSSSGQLSSCV